MTSGAERLSELRARMDADLERFRERVAEVRQLSDDLARANAAPGPTSAPVTDAEADYRPDTWLV